MNERKCYYCGSTDGTTNYLNKGIYICKKHQKQIRKYGKIKTTIYDANVIRIFDTYAEFDTRDKNGNVNGTFLIDLDIVDFVKTHKIYKSNEGYASYKIKKDDKTLNMRLHRYIMDVHNQSSSIFIDHINQNKYDNRRSNLRITTQEGNNRNVKEYSHNTSGHKGVSWSKQRNCWESYIHKNNKKINLGLYHDFNKAVAVREMAELIIYGEQSSEYEYLCKKYKKDEYESYLK